MQRGPHEGDSRRYFVVFKGMKTVKPNASFSLSLSLSLALTWMSLMNREMSFINRSTPCSVPVFSKVVIAKVAMDRFESAISGSRSPLHRTTASGWVRETRLSSRTAAKRFTARGDERKSWRTVIAGARSRRVTSGREQIDLAASKMTISDLCRRHPSRYAYAPCASVGEMSPCSILVVYRMSWQTARGDRRELRVRPVMSLEMPTRSFCLMR